MRYYQLNYLLLVGFTVLRTLDLVTTYFALELKKGYEGNPLGFNLFIVIFTYVYCIIFLLCNYVSRNLKTVTILLFIGLVFWNFVNIFVVINNSIVLLS